ncbi:hypothetical protein [Frigoriflavimonas asaccharolytica]|uniref:DNA polymerase-3 subunit gamma/tau n=1 Tax=Frigoriflavimonas asaccharolytica TaxID=2735899 RepID=A0A8J8K9H0_9FLAO|nr:hypothetical protein [Frigoriflavimonas asaccharolytica]NRS93062.1 DNA polymerase-3 subunit gamma/tau [Frigoriflavimonas asaccharolytica]
MEEIPAEVVVKKAEKPLLKQSSPSKFSIKNILESKPEEILESTSENLTKNLPANHFTETDLQKYWHSFLENIRKDDIVTYNAISGFKLIKLEENTIEIRFPSHTAKSEFDKISHDFLNGFSHVVNNHSIEIKFENLGGQMKKQATTKRTIFDSFCEINPLLRELDKTFKFDLD